MGSFLGEVANFFWVVRGFHAKWRVP